MRSRHDLGRNCLSDFTDVIIYLRAFVPVVKLRRRLKLLKLRAIWPRSKS